MTVKVFATQSCPYCKMLKSYLEEKKVMFETVMVDENQAGMEEMMKVSDGYMGVPFSVVTRNDGSVVKIPGFDKAKFEEAFGIS